jgi:hypothetical protein
MGDRTVHDKPPDRAEAAEKTDTEHHRNVHPTT